ncbi:MAG: hypothetical protein RL719_195, partial [Actinomycetota bacterium]
MPTLVLLAVTAALLAVGFVLPQAWWVSAGLGALVALRMLWVSIREGQVGSDILALISISATALIGEWLASAIIALMLATGQALETWAAGRARNQLEALVQRAPKLIHLVMQDGTVVQEDLSRGKVGDRFLVRTGEVVALDGVLESDASFDESALTGEPIPKDRKTGDDVSSGVVNVSPPVVLRATTDATSSTYSALVR